jgi:hypothetical protein
MFTYADFMPYLGIFRHFVSIVGLLWYISPQQAKQCVRKEIWIDQINLVKNCKMCYFCNFFALSIAD